MKPLAAHFLLRPLLTCLALQFAGLLSADADVFDPDRAFTDAHAAYVAGDHAAATEGYRALIANGFDTAEVWYNLANARFHAGAPGEAVLYYRRAWLLQPRDADVQANLQLVAQRTGAILPDVRWWQKAGQEFTAAEWRTVLLSGYWTALLAWIAGLLAPALRRFTRPLAAAAFAVGLTGLAGWAQWIHWSGRAEAVVVRPDQTALYEPRDSATPYFALPEGSILYIEDAFDAWVKVAADGKRGWVPRDAVAQVHPWFSTGMQ